MNPTAMKAMPLALLLIATCAAAAGNEPAEKSEKKEKRVIVTDEGVFSSDGDEPLVWRFPRRARPIECAGETLSVTAVSSSRRGASYSDSRRRRIEDRPFRPPACGR